MKTLYLFLLLFLCLSTVFAQVFPVSAVDSLQKVVASPLTTDSHRVMTLHEISWAFVNKDNDLARIYADSAYAMGHKIAFQDGIRRSAHILANLDFLASDYEGAEAYAEEAKEIAVANQQPANVARHNSIISNVYKKTGRQEEAIALNKESLDLALDLQDTVLIIPLQYNYSIKLAEQGRMEESSQLLVRLLDYPLSYYQASLILERVCDTYLSRNMGEKGLPYCRQALGIADFEKNRQGAYRIYHRVGKYFYNQGELDSARQYLQIILDTRRKETDYALALIDMANIDMDEAKLADANNKVRQAMSLLQKEERMDLAGGALRLRADLNAKAKKFQQAIDDYDAALALTKEPEDRMKLLNNCIRIRMRSNNYVPESYFVEYNQIKDSLQSAALDEKATLVIEEFENDRLRDQQALAEEQAKADRLAINQQRYGLGIIGLLALFLTAAFLYQRRSKKREVRLNAKLKSQNEEIQAKNNRITLLNQDINHRTSGYLFNIIKLLKEQRFKLEDAGADPGVLDELERQTLIYTKLQGLLTTVDDRTVVNLKAYLQELTTLLETSFRGGGMPLQLSLKAADLNIDPKLAAPLALILNELMTNTAKYAIRRGGGAAARGGGPPAKENTLLLTYEDDGPDTNRDTSEHFSSEMGLDLIDGLTHQMEAERLPADGFAYRARVEL